MDEYHVTLNNVTKSVGAFNPLMAAITAFPESFNYRYIDEMTLGHPRENVWNLVMKSTVTYISYKIILVPA